LFEQGCESDLSLKLPATRAGLAVAQNHPPDLPAVIIGVQWHTIPLDSWCPMEYKRTVQTVVETPTYLAIANKLFSEEERADIVALLAADPECGDLIRGTGGFRKVRVARKGMGKSGGARVVYIWRSESFPVFLITVFPKNEKENLPMAERNTLRKRADSIFGTYGR